MISPSGVYALDCYIFICLFTRLLGVELVATFERELIKHEKNRQELANAEKLFDLPITMYPELIKVQKEMSGLKQIYELYQDLKVRVPTGSASPEQCLHHGGPAGLGATVTEMSLGQMSQKLPVWLLGRGDGE